MQSQHFLSFSTPNSALIYYLKLVQDMKNFIFTLLLLIFLSPVYGNSPIIIQEELKWESSPFVFTLEGQQVELWRFDGAIVGDEFPTLPFVVKRFPLESYGNLSVDIINVQYEPFDKQPSPDDDKLSDRLVFETVVEKERNNYFGKLLFAPIIKSGAGFERVVSYQIRINHTPQPVVTFRGPDNTDNSVLSDGEIYKIAVTQTGIHQLTYSFLKDELGIDIDAVDPRQIKLYGNGGGLLPVYTSQ